MPSWRAGDRGQGVLQASLPRAHGAPALPCWAMGLPKSSAHTPCNGTEDPGEGFLEEKEARQSHAGEEERRGRHPDGRTEGDTE